MNFKTTLLIALFCLLPISALAMVIDTSNLSDDDIGSIDACVSESRFVLSANQQICESDNECVNRKLRFMIRTTQNILGLGDVDGTINLVVLNTIFDVQRKYKEYFDGHKEVVQFYDKKTATIYLPKVGCQYEVLFHEISHAVVNHYFDKPIPKEIDEVLAKFVASQM